MKRTLKALLSIFFTNLLQRNEAVVEAMITASPQLMASFFHIIHSYHYNRTSSSSEELSTLSLNNAKEDDKILTNSRKRKGSVLSPCCSKKRKTHEATELGQNDLQMNIGEPVQENEAMQVDSDPEVEEGLAMEVDQPVSEPYTFDDQVDSIVHKMHPLVFSLEISECFSRAFAGSNDLSRQRIQTLTVDLLNLRNEHLDDSHIHISLTNALRDILLNFCHLETDFQNNVIGLVQRVLPHIDQELLLVLELWKVKRT